MTLGQYAMMLVIGWQTYDIARTGGMSMQGAAGQLALIGLLQFIPLFVLSPFTGLAADRFSRRLLGQSTINFRTASAVISANSQSLLDRIADVAKGCPGDLVVEGHTDNVGDAAYNKNLSRQRAQAVVDALTKLGIDPNRLTASGFGEDRPRASNNTPAGRAQNRRIEIKVADLN